MKTTDSLIQAVTAMGNNTILTPAYNTPVTTESYWKNSTGIIQYLLGGAFATEPSSASKFSITNQTIKAIYSVAVSNIWNQQGVYIVNCSNLYDDRGLNYSMMHIDKGDLTR